MLTLLEDFKEHPIVPPDIILCSPCLYVRQTMDLLHEVLSSSDVLYKDGLYSAPDYRILEVINGLDDILMKVMIVGELPGLKQFLGYIYEPYATVKLQSGTMVQLDLKSKESWHNFGYTSTNRSRRVI